MKTKLIGVTITCFVLMMNTFAASDLSAFSGNQERVSCETLDQPSSLKGLTNVRISVAPMLNFVGKTVSVIDRSEVDLKKNFSIEIESCISEKGVLIEDRTNLKSFSGDRAMGGLMQEGVKAFGKSGWLSYLSESGASAVTIKITQDDDHFTGFVSTQYSSENNAKRASSALILLANLIKKYYAERMTADELNLRKALRINYKGARLTLQIKMTKSDAHEMIERNLKLYRQRQEELRQRETSVNQPK